MEQADFIRRVAEAPGAFFMVLTGAGVSQSSGLPTALDIIWDLKRRYYSSEEHQEISANDLQNAAIWREKIDAFMQSRGFPATTDPTAYSLQLRTDLWQMITLVKVNICRLRCRRREEFVSNARSSEPSLGLIAVDGDQSYFYD